MKLGALAAAISLLAFGCMDEGLETGSEEQAATSPIDVDPNPGTPTIPAGPLDPNGPLIPVNPGGGGGGAGGGGGGGGGGGVGGGDGGDDELNLAECGGNPDGAAATASVGSLTSLRAQRIASDQSSYDTYTHCNYGALKDTNLHWAYSTSAPASTTVRFFWEKCTPDATNPLDASLCMPAPGLVRHCMKAAKTNGRYEKTTVISVDEGGSATFRMRPVQTANGVTTYGTWTRSETVGPYDFHLHSPTISLIDYRSKIAWASNLLSVFAQVNIPGLNVLDNLNLAPIANLFNKGTLSVQSRDSRSGYILMFFPDTQPERNGLYDYTGYGRTIVVSLPSMPLGVAGAAEGNYGCWDPRFGTSSGETTLTCQAFGMCTSTSND